MLSDFKWHLKAVEFSVTEDTVVVLVGNVEYSAKGSDTQWFQLGTDIGGTKMLSLFNRAFACAYENKKTGRDGHADSTVGITFPKKG